MASLPHLSPRTAGRHATQLWPWVQTQLADTTLFVEVLTRFCEDPRDLAQVRLAEAKLQAEVAQLQAAQAGLQGQPHSNGGSPPAGAPLGRSEDAEREHARQQTRIAALEAKKAELEVLPVHLTWGLEWTSTGWRGSGLWWCMRI